MSRLKPHRNYYSKQYHSKASRQQSGEAVGILSERSKRIPKAELNKKYIKERLKKQK